MVVASASQRMTNRPDGGVAPDGGHGPMAGGVGQPPVRGESALDQDCPSRPSHDGGDAEVAPQGLQIGLPDAVEGFGDDDVQDRGSDPGNGFQDFDGASALGLLDPVENLLAPVPDVLDLRVDGFEPSDDPRGGFGDGLDGSRRGRDGPPRRRATASRTGPRPCSPP